MANPAIRHIAGLYATNNNHRASFTPVFCLSGYSAGPPSVGYLVVNIQRGDMLKLLEMIQTSYMLLMTKYLTICFLHNSFTYPVFLLHQCSNKLSSRALC